MTTMTDSELKSILAAEIADSFAHLGGELSEQRRKALRYYLGEPFGNEQEGRSKVVSTDVADVVEWILPALLRIFTAGDEVVRFEPTGPEDEEVAKQATEYVNWIFARDNAGFLNLYMLFKDALLQKNGIAKVWWEEAEPATRESYSRKSFEEIQLILMDPEVEPIAHSEYQDQGVVIGPNGLPVETAVTHHDLVVKRRRKCGAVRIMTVPPEEFLISRRARSIEEAPFVAHRLRKTVSELIEMGYDRDLVGRLPESEEDDPTGERRERFALEEDHDRNAADGPNRAMREIWLTECYIKCDWDGDGIAERRKITVAGGGQEILDNEPWDGPIPFISLTPIPMPHRFFGLSIADLVMDLQLIKSTILRQILDNLYLSNNGRHIISDQVNLDDLLTARPGGIVRLKNGALPGQGHIVPLDTPLVAAQAFPMLEYIDGVREDRTGVTRYTQGLDADTLNKTATGINQIMTAAQQRVELIARVFAETGVKDLFRKILELVNRHRASSACGTAGCRWIRASGTRRWTFRSASASAPATRTRCSPTCEACWTSRCRPSGCRAASTARWCGSRTCTTRSPSWWRTPGSNPPTPTSRIRRSDRRRRRLHRRRRSLIRRWWRCSSRPGSKPPASRSIDSARPQTWLSTAPGSRPISRSSAMRWP